MSWKYIFKIKFHLLYFKKGLTTSWNIFICSHLNLLCHPSLSLALFISPTFFLCHSLSLLLILSFPLPFCLSCFFFISPTLFQSQSLILTLFIFPTLFLSHYFYLLFFLSLPLSFSFAHMCVCVQKYDICWLRIEQLFNSFYVLIVGVPHLGGTTCRGYHM